MNELPDLIKEGSGVLYGVGNLTDQPGKSVTLLDGETMLCHLPLDEAFISEHRDEDTGETVTWPGIFLHIAFITDLRAKTDGNVSVYWRE
jgi:hypothetical protein